MRPGFRAIGVALTSLLCILNSIPAAVGQGGSYCSVTDVDVRQLSNAVRITIKADGVLESAIRIMDFWEQEDGVWSLRPIESVPFQLSNARSTVGSLITIDAYPVSHLKLNTPPSSRAGVGLDCELVLYTRAVAGRIRTAGGSFGGRQLRADVQVDMERSGDGMEFYLTVLSDKYVDVADIVRPARIDVPPELAVSLNSSGRLDIKAVNAGMREALQQVGEFADARILIDDAVDNRLTCHLEDVPFRDALDAIAAGYGLVVAQHDGAHFVSRALPDGTAAYWLADSAVIPLRYLSPADALPLLPDYVLRFVKRHKDGNALVVTGSPALIDKVRSDIEKVDRPGLQMNVRALLVQTSSTRSYERVIELLLGGGDTEWELDTARSSLRFAVLPDRLTEVRARLRAMQRDSAISLCVEPHMTVVSGGRAEFFFGTRQYFKFRRPTSAGTEAVIRSADVGVKLAVTPWGATREHITVPVTVDASNIVAVGTGGLPTVARRTADATLVVASGETVIVGGLRSASPETTVQRTAPWLLPAPLQGVGQSKSTAVTEHDALVLLQVEANGFPPIQRGSEWEETP